LWDSDVNAKSAIRNKTWAELNVGAQVYEYWRREGRAFGVQETVAKAAE
jgi:hypothetical protein